MLKKYSPLNYNSEHCYILGDLNGPTNGMTTAAPAKGPDAPTNAPNGATTGAPSGGAPSGGNSRNKRQAMTEGEELRPPPTAELSEERESENSFLMSYMSLPKEIRIEIGHNYSSFIQSCTFMGQECSNQRLISFF